MANRKQLYDYKGECCANCGMTVEEMVRRFRTVERIFDFNHVDPDQKHPQYKNLIRRKLSTEQLEEVDKCVLLCKICHGVLHSQGINGNVNFSMTLEGKIATQTVRGQVIIDWGLKRAKFLTNERVLVIPYLVFRGKRKPELYFGTELETDKLLHAFFRELPKTKRFRVKSYRDHCLLLDVMSTGGPNFKLEMDVTFPVVTSELYREEGENPIVWLRNGICLTKDGQIIRQGTVIMEGTVEGF